MLLGLAKGGGISGGRRRKGTRGWPKASDNVVSCLHLDTSLNTPHLPVQGRVQKSQDANESGPLVLRATSDRDDFGL